MDRKCFDVQVVFLYNAAPVIDAHDVVAWCADWARRNQIEVDFKQVSDAPAEAVLCLAGGGVHATIAVRDHPEEPAHFAAALRSPVINIKGFDFAGAVGQHRSSVTITVGDGETPQSPETCQNLLATGLLKAAEPELKLAVLNMVMQGVAALGTPLMADFGPSRSLLTPEDLNAVADMALPLPILFQPVPVRNAPDAKGKPRTGLMARHAELYIGARLELEALPKGLPAADGVDILAYLLTAHHAGNLSLNHGDCFESMDGRKVWVRHEDDADPESFSKIIASFDTPAPERAPESRGEAQRAFQDRIARLKARAAPTAPFVEPDTTAITPPEPAIAGENPEDLRARIQETIDPGRHRNFATSGSSFGLPLKLIAATAILAAFIFTGGGQNLAELNKLDDERTKALLKSIRQNEATPVRVIDARPLQAGNALRPTFQSAP